MEKLSFADLIDIRALKSMQDSFAKYTGLSICVVGPDGMPILRVSGGCEFCQRYTKGSVVGSKRCAECDKKGEQLAFSQKKAVHYTCHAGMTDFVIPIVYENRVIGAILAGQVRSEELDTEKLREIAAEIGADPDEYVKAAMEANFMSNEDAEKTTEFLSEFSNALSIMAHTNYKKNKELEKTERIARSQSNFVTGLTVDLKKNMRGWLNTFQEVTEKYADIPEVRCETNDLLAKGKEVYSLISGAVDYIKMSGGSAEYSEGIYDVRYLIENTVYSLRKEAEASGINVKVNFGVSLPQTLAGNSGRIGQIVSTLCTSVIEHTPDGGEVEVEVSCKKTKYSCNLTVRVTGTKTYMDDKTAESVRKLIETSGENVFESETLTANGSNLPLVILLLKQMSGSICAEKLENGNVIFSMTVPQLDGAKQKA